jgi:hypothetical protein
LFDRLRCPKAAPHEHGCAGEREDDDADRDPGLHPVKVALEGGHDPGDHERGRNQEPDRQSASSPPRSGCGIAPVVVGRGGAAILESGTRRANLK